MTGARRLADDGRRLARRAGLELTGGDGDPLLAIRRKDMLDRLAAALGAIKEAGQAMQRLVEQPA